MHPQREEEEDEDVRADLLPLLRGRDTDRNYFYMVKMQYSQYQQNTAYLEMKHPAAMGSCCYGFVPQPSDDIMNAFPLNWRTSALSYTAIHPS